MATKLCDYLCWDEHTYRDDGVVICSTSYSEAANEYLSEHLLKRESVSELNNVIILVAGPEPKTYLFEISVEMEPVCYLNEKAG